MSALRVLIILKHYKTLNIYKKHLKGALV